MMIKGISISNMTLYRTYKDAYCAQVGLIANRFVKLMLIMINVQRKKVAMSAKRLC